MTVHNAQGSEAHTVIQVASTSQHIMLYRQLFYTALTRARRKLYVVGTEAAIMRACRNVGNTIRRTHLQYFLQLIRYQNHTATNKQQSGQDAYAEKEAAARREKRARNEHNSWGDDYA